MFWLNDCGSRAETCCQLVTCLSKDKRERAKGDVAVRIRVVGWRVRACVQVKEARIGERDLSEVTG